MDFEDDSGQQTDMSSTPTGAVGPNEPDETPKNRALVQEIIKSIKADKRHHAKAFKRMRRDMQVAMWGAEKDWGEHLYRANIAGRHVKQKTAALYAKNPRVTARRREQMDFAVWDENPQSLMLAMQVIQAAQQAQQTQAATGQSMPGQPPAAQPGADPAMGHNGGPPLAPPTELPPGFDQAMQTIADFQQGYARRQYFTKVGKTLELLFGYFMSQQMPLDFKQGMKQVVRRAVTTGVGYVEVGFQREMGPRPGLQEQLADAQVRIDHLKRLSQEYAEGEIGADDAEMAELEFSMQSLQAEPNIVLREGLVIDYPASTKAIPDKLTKSLNGFIGARHLTIEYLYTKDEVEELFGVDLGDRFTSYTSNAGSSRDIATTDVLDDDYEWSMPGEKKTGMVCVWKHYDKPSGQVYYVADGHPDFLRPPAAPDVFVETFWPVFALTFNAVESEDELFPPSDVSLMLDMQREHNRSRQGLREHRDAARPRWVAANGAFGSEEDPMRLKSMKPFELQMLNMDPSTKIGDILQVVPVPGVDPNLYETNPIFTDTQLVVGAQEAQFGGVSKATATESAIAANSSTSADGSSIDDLDAFLSSIARAGGQILQNEMSEESVKKIVGPGAVWPPMSLAEISQEIYLEVAAGSTGKPNQATEINNMERLMPFLLQMPSISPDWLAKETLRRLDDRLDLTDAVAAGIPSIVSQNSNAQPAPSDPGNDPNAQGGKGANNAPAAPGGPGGSNAHFGSNQVSGRV